MDWETDTFYITGGTLPTGAPCYVERQADTDLLDGLLSGEFCYVLSTRQMGKSSLMVRTAQRLRQNGRAVVLLDLTAIGYNVTPEAWYDGLLTLLGEQLNRSDELEDFWEEHSRLGPLQRWMTALVQVVLPLLDHPLVIFIDEIDAVLSLSFSVDEFFNSIRECYNRRAQDPAYRNITFCLIGVAAPSDLVKETRVSPFNIGRRIVLSDFTQEECHPLLAGFTPIASSSKERELLLSRILHWTDGHPYMTQRLCSAIIEALTVANSVALSSETIWSEVDRHCEQLFLTHQARDVDANLAFVRNRLLDGVIDIAGLLDMYDKVYRGARVPDDDTSPFCTNLRLSGIVRVEGGVLKVRNRIFECVFDRAWVRENMPNAELRRQQAAYRLGVLRTAAAASIVVVIITGLAFANFFNVRRAHKAEAFALEQSKLARNQAEYATRLVYAFNINLASERYKTSGLTSVEETLEQAMPEVDKPDLRGFEWYYLNRLCHNYLTEMQANKDSIHSIAFSPDGETVAGAGHSGEVHFWATATGRHLRSVHALSESVVWSIAWSPDGKTVVAGCEDKTLYIWNAATLRPIHVLKRHSAAVTSVTYSPNGELIASGSADRTARIWDAKTGREIRTITGFTLRGVWSVAFSPNGKLLATGGDDGVARLWDIATGREVRSMKGHSWYVYSLAFSPDGKTLATGSGDTNAILWEVDSGRLLYTLRGHSSYIYSVAFSPDGKTLGTGSWDKTVRLWDTRTGAQLKTVPNTQTVQSIAFHPGSKVLAVACSDSTLRLWSWRDDLDSRSFIGHTKRIDAIAFSPDSRRVVTGGEDGTARVWDVEAGRVIESITGAVGGITRIAYSQEGWRVLANGRFLDSRFNRAGQGYIQNFSSDEARLRVLQRGSGSDLINSETGRVLSSFPALRDVRGRERFSADGSLFQYYTVRLRFNAYYDLLTLHIFNASNGFEVLQLDDVEPFDGTAFSQDANRIAVGFHRGSVKVYDIASGRLLLTLKGHTSQVYSIVFSLDDNRIFTGGLDGNVKVWDAYTGRELLTLHAPKEVWSLEISPDGQHLVAGCVDGSVKVWDAPIVNTAPIRK